MLSTVTKASSQVARLPGFLIGNVNKVAAEAYEACINGDVVRVPGVLNLATILAARSTPKWLLRRIIS